ncbi:MAG: lamin tail domain-containing protein [Bacteroidota bacterium]
MNRSALGDFVTTSSSTRSSPNAALSTDATISQTLTSPAFDFTGRVVDRLEFYERRSSSHNSSVMVEASIDGGKKFFAISDTLLNPGNTSYNLNLLDLPDTLSDQANVKFRWRVFGNGTGRTGTYRIDDVLVSVRPSVDLAVGAVHLPTAALFVGDQVSVGVTVRNLAARSVSNFGVAFFLAAQGIDSPSEAERYDSISVITPVAPGDSLLLTARPVGAVAEFPTILVRVTIVGDEDISNNVGSALLNVGYPPSTIIVNEILYAPSSSEPEWIELVNTSTDSINAKNWNITDKSGSKALLTSKDFFIQGLGYLVLADDSSLFTVHPTATSATLIMNIPSLNNTGDAVILFDNRNLTMDSLMYSPSWGGSGGRSLERILPRGSSTDPSNWGTSRDPNRSTPGKKNSLTPKDFDLGVSRVLIDPASLTVGDDVLLQAMVVNRGLRSADRYSIEFYEDVDRDSIAQEEERFFLHEELHPLLSGDSLLFSSQLLNVSPGLHQIIVKIVFSVDEDTTNNVRIVNFRTGFPPGTVVVNEIVYAPGTGQPEWVELLNTSEYAVSLNGWTLANHITTKRYEIEGSDRILAPQVHMVITKDSSVFFTSHAHVTGTVLEVARLPTFFLGNSGDAVILRDDGGITIDSVAFLASWGGAHGRSLERIDALGSSTDSSNWGTSVDSLGSTPTRKNSLVPLNVDLAIRTVQVNPPFTSIHGDVSFLVTVQNVGFQTINGFEVQLAVDENRDGLVQELEIRRSVTTDRALARRDSFVVLLEYGPVKPEESRFIVALNAAGDQNLRNNVMIQSLHFRYRDRSVLINEIMYDPLPGGAEYVEIFNRSSYDISLQGWTVSDRPNLKGNVNLFPLSSSVLFLPSGGYAVLASDSSLFASFPELREMTGIELVLFSGSGLSLNNDGDAIILKDSGGYTIDSVSYLPQWHNPEVIDGTGRALERIYPEAGSNNSRNWSTSADRRGGTPGQQNSIFASFTLSDTRVSFSPNPFSPDGDGFEDFTVMHYNLPLTAATVRVKIYDSVGRVVRILSHGEPSGSQGDLIWDGLDDDRQRLRMGIYIVLLEALDSVGGELETAKAVVVLAGRL